MDHHRINTNRFLRHWLINSIVIWPGVAITCILAWIPAALLWTFLIHKAHFSTELIEGLRIPLFLWFGLVSGYTIGDWQTRLIHEHLHWHLPGWGRFSAAGGVLGMGFLLLVGSFLKQWLPEYTYLTMMPLYIAGLSTMQWFILRKTSHEAWLWVLGNIVAGIVFSGLLFFNQPVPFSPFSRVLTLGLWIIAAGAQGFITGIVLLWLYDRPVSEQSRADRTLAPVYIEVRDRSDNRWWRPEIRK